VYREFVDAADGPQALKMRKTSGVKHPVMEKAVNSWFATNRADGVPLSGPMIQAQALQIHQQLFPQAPDSSFRASRGWLQKWQKRHGVKAVTIQGEVRSADHQAA